MSAAAEREARGFKARRQPRLEFHRRARQICQYMRAIQNCAFYLVCVSNVIIFCLFQNILIFLQRVLQIMLDFYTQLS